MEELLEKVAQNAFHDELEKIAAQKGEKVKPGSLKGGPSEPASKAKAGSGGRFKALAAELSKKSEFEIRPDVLEKAAAAVRDPKALAAAIGRAKYGKKKFQEMAAAGKRKK